MAVGGGSSVWPAMVLSVVLLLSGCGGSNSGLAGPRDPGRHVKDASSDVTCGDKLRVDVIDNGALPRHPMVFNLAVGQRESTHNDIDITTTNDETEGEEPTKSSTKASGVSADVVATVDAVDDKAIKMTTRYDKLTATTPEGQKAVDELKDKVTPLSFSPRGRPLGGGDGNAQTDKLVTGSITPFPDEDVGAGARWQAWAPTDVSGVKMCFLNTYTLDKFDGKAYELSGDTKVVVAKGRSQQEKFGITINIEYRGGEGTGTIRSVGSLDNFYPDSGETTSSLKFTVATSAQGVGEYVLTTDQSLKVTVSRPAPA